MSDLFRKYSNDLTYFSLFIVNHHPNILISTFQLPDFLVLCKFQLKSLLLCQPSCILYVIQIHSKPQLWDVVQLLFGKLEKWLLFFISVAFGVVCSYLSVRYSVVFQ